MGICGWIILGGLAGWVASMIAGNNSRQGLIGNIVVGCIGAFVGGIIFNYFGRFGVTTAPTQRHAEAVSSAGSRRSGRSS